MARTLEFLALVRWFNGKGYAPYARMAQEYLDRLQDIDFFPTSTYAKRQFEILIALQACVSTFETREQFLQDFPHMRGIVEKISTHLESA